LTFTFQPYAAPALPGRFLQFLACGVCHMADVITHVEY